jgi:hypothetical protein
LKFNSALHFLSGAINFDPVVTVVDANWLRKLFGIAFITNVDRTFNYADLITKSYGLLIMASFTFITLTN